MERWQTRWPRQQGVPGQHEVDPVSRRSCLYAVRRAGRYAAQPRSTAPSDRSRSRCRRGVLSRTAPRLPFRSRRGSSRLAATRRPSSPAAAFGQRACAGARSCRRERCRYAARRCRGRGNTRVVRADSRTQSCRHTPSAREALRPRPLRDRVRIPRSRAYLTSVSILNIGKYIEITITPTIAPTMIIISGSMIDVSVEIAESTSSS